VARYFRLVVDERGGTGHTGLASSACRRGGKGCGADRIGLYADVPRHRLAVGPADVGYVLGLGRAVDLGAGLVPDVSRRDRAMAHRRGPDPGCAGGRGTDTRWRNQRSHYQILGRLVEHAAPAGLRAAPRRIDDPSCDSRAAHRHGDRIHALVPDPAPGRHAQRNHAAARTQHDDAAGGRPGRIVMMQLGPHAAFIVTAYAAAIAIVAALVAWIVLDQRHLARLLEELEAHGVTRRSGRANGEKW